MMRIAVGMPFLRALRSTPSQSGTSCASRTVAITMSGGWVRRPRMQAASLVRLKSSLPGITAAARAAPPPMCTRPSSLRQAHCTLPVRSATTAHADRRSQSRWPMRRRLHPCLFLCSLVMPVLHALSHADRPARARHKPFSSPDPQWTIASRSSICQSQLASQLVTESGREYP